jgi:hypothetical protein
VKITTASDDPSLAGQDAARRRLRGAGCSNPGAGTSAYNLSGSRVSGSQTVHFSPGRAPIAGAASVFQAAYNAWDAADPNAPSMSVVSDGTALAPSANHRYEIMFKRLGGRTLAITYTWHWSTGEWESDTAFSTTVPWFNAPGEGDGCYEGVAKYDLQNTATHEFGHVFGLTHVSSTYNTMAPTATMGETYKRSLASGDVLGLRAIYG